MIYDGTRFTDIIPGTNVKFPNVEAYRLGVGNDGVIWIGSTSSGLYRIEGSDIKHWDLENGLDSHIIRKIEVANNGVYVNSDGKVLFFEYKKEPSINVITAQDENLFINSFKDKNKQLIYANELESRIFKTKTNITSDSTLNLEHDNTVILAENGKIFKIKNGISGLFLSNFLKNTQVDITNLLLDKSNNLWVATAKNGLFRYGDNGLEQFDHLPNDRLSSLVEDVDGAIWVGTSGGLCMLKTGPIKNLGVEQGLFNENIHSVHLGFDDKVYGVPYGKISQLVAIEGGLINNINLNEDNGKEGYVIQGIDYTSDGGLWLATETMIGKLVNNSIVKLIDLEAKSKVFLAKGNVFWYQENNSIIRLKDNKKTIIPFDNKDDIDVRSMSFSQGGDILIAEKKNAYRLADSKIHNINIPTGIASCIHEFVKDELWICSDGLWLRTKNKNYYLDKDNNLTPVVNGHIHDVIADLDGNIWAVTNSGLYRLLRKDIDDLISGKDLKPQFIKFSEKDGMKSGEFNGSSSSAVMTKDGKLWFASQAGIVKVDPGLVLPLSDKVINPFIEHLYIGENLIEQKDWLQIKPNARGIHFHFGAVFLSDAKNLTFRYKVEPIHSEWVIGDVAVLLELEAGSYQLSVQVKHNQNSWSKTLIKNLTVLPAWHQEFWVRVFAVLCIVAIVVGVPLYRINRLKQNRKALRRLVREKTESLLIANQRLEMLAKADELTGISNRRDFINQINHLCDDSHSQFCLVLLDVDDFKLYNDYYGHLAGDECLKSVANVLDRYSTDENLVARFGGEEFVMLFRNVELEEAYVMLKLFLESLKDEKIQHIRSTVTKIISVSAGLVSRKTGESVESVIDRADIAMYKAKFKGKDRIVIDKADD